MTKDKTPTTLDDQDLDGATGGDGVARWNFENAWPSKFTAPTLSAKGGGEVAMEELSLSTEGMDLDAGETPPLDVSYTLKR